VSVWVVCDALLKDFASGLFCSTCQFFDSQSFSIVGTIQPIRVLGNRYGYRSLLTFTGASRTKFKLYVAVAMLSKLLDRGHTGKSFSISSLGVSLQ